MAAAACVPGGSRGRRGTRSRTQAGPGAGPRAGGAGCLAGPASCVDGRAAQARDASSGRACTASLGAVASGAGAVRYLVVPLGDFQIPSLAPSSFPERSAGAVKGGEGFCVGPNVSSFSPLGVVASEARDAGARQPEQERRRFRSRPVLPRPCGPRSSHGRFGGRRAGRGTRGPRKTLPVSPQGFLAEG